MVNQDCNNNYSLDNHLLYSCENQVNCSLTLTKNLFFEGCVNKLKENKTEEHEKVHPYFRLTCNCISSFFISSTGSIGFSFVLPIPFIVLVDGDWILSDLNLNCFGVVSFTALVFWFSNFLMKRER